MKTALVIVIGVLLWQSTDARKFTSNVLQTASDFIEPSNTKQQTIGERIDSFLDWITGQHSISVRPRFNQTKLTLSFLKMTRSTALGMLRVGNTGDEILQILDVIVADIESEKTINEIAEILFWE